MFLYKYQKLIVIVMILKTFLNWNCYGVLAVVLSAFNFELVNFFFLLLKYLQTCAIEQFPSKPWNNITWTPQLDRILWFGIAVVYCLCIEHSQTLKPETRRVPQPYRHFAIRQFWVYFVFTSGVNKPQTLNPKMWTQNIFTFCNSTFLISFCLWVGCF